MTARSGLFVAPTAAGVGTAAVDARIALAGILGTTTPQCIQGGAITQSATTMAFTIAQAVLELPDPTNTASAFISPIDQTVLTPAAGPATGSRVDLIVAKQNNVENGDTDSRANFSIIPGVAGAPGVAPAVPAGYFRYADINVPALASNAAACTVTLRSPQSFAPEWILSPTWALLQTITGQAGQHASVTTDPIAANNTDYAWNGSRWRPLQLGLNLITPTSVVGGTLNPNGSVSFSAAGAVSLNGVFSSVYDNYLVKLDVSQSSAVADLNMRLRSAGTDFSAASHLNTLQEIASATPTYSYSATATAITVGRVNGTGGGISRIDIDAPALAQYTNVICQSSDAGANRNTSGVVKTTNQFDGLSVFPSTGTLSGTVRVYGFYNG